MVLYAINERMLTHTNDRRCKIDLNVPVIVSSTLLFATLTIRGGNTRRVKLKALRSAPGWETAKRWRILYSSSSLRNVFAL
jgi:hypothetical protein